MEELVKLLPRYLRRPAKFKASKEEEVVENDIVRRVEWLDGFYALPGNCSLSVLKGEGEDYRAQGFFPMDAASALAVAALDLPCNAPVKVLDLCCCPGNKMQYVAEQVHEQSVIVGVDISQDRIFVCKSLLEQWQSWILSQKVSPSQVPRVLVFKADGQTFGPNSFGHLLADSTFVFQELSLGKSGKSLRNKSSRAKERHAMALISQTLKAGSDAGGEQKEEEKEVALRLDQFDRVLVDAECTHDASYRHMCFSSESRKWSSSSPHLSHDITDLDQLDEKKTELLELQRSLLRNGFHRLAPGGSLVYSTCSHDEAQNEDAVRWLLREEATAQLVSIPCTKDNHEEQTLREIARLTGAEDEPSEAEPPSKRARAELHGENSAERLVQLVCQLRRPPLQESPFLPGTIRIGSEVGMSGHFIARISKMKV
eukprot:gene6460-7124_t